MSVSNVFLTSEYGWKKVNITTRNDDPVKTVTAFKVKVAMWDAFNERVFYYGDEFFSSYTNPFSLPPGESTQKTWDLTLSSPTSAEAFVYKVQYSDGSSWDLYDE